MGGGEEREREVVGRGREKGRDTSLSPGTSSRLSIGGGKKARDRRGGEGPITLIV